MRPAAAYIIVFLLGISFTVKSQPRYVQEWQAWFRYYNQTQFTKRLVLHAELDERRRLNPWSQFQFFTHLHLHYRIKPWLDVAAGMNYNLTNLAAGSVYEWRPWQEASIIKELDKSWQFQFRYRLDERFIHRSDPPNGSEADHFNWRHRLRVQFTKTITADKDHPLSMKLYDEVMLNSGDVSRTFDQNRLAMLLEYKMSDHWSIESGYILLIQQISNDVFSERHVIRTTLYHRIGFKP